MTHISLGNETCLIKTFSLIYLLFPFLFSPAQNKQNPNAIETGQRTTPTVDQPILTLAHKSFPGWIHPRSKPNHYCPEGCIGGSIPPKSRRFSSKFPSNLGPFLLSQLTIYFPPLIDHEIMNGSQTGSLSRSLSFSLFDLSVEIFIPF